MLTNEETLLTDEEFWQQDADMSRELEIPNKVALAIIRKNNEYCMTGYNSQKCRSDERV